MDPTPIARLGYTYVFGHGGQPDLFLLLMFRTLKIIIIFSVRKLRVVTVYNVTLFVSKLIIFFSQNTDSQTPYIITMVFK